ncbi:IclR family transcriptional regulator [Histidinibacterium aquaticum]|uniref:IclR family transcriptional regulator n=1 Tax=Histidinibacterium aquaticum TaxID=2613962 RepID=A0A5J5GC59_9RHOB|nr:IclR family transcriptional regulator [Histidinibacterium aquaticum]KAA9005746.1 IclR family transcriptional regulator [Histidinibacterium aquaticum]
MDDHLRTGRSEGTVGKALDALDLVCAQDRPVRFSELLPLSPWPKGTLYRLLQTLVKQGMLHVEPETGSYTPGLRLVQLAHSAWRKSSLAPIARPHLDALSGKVGETIHLAQLDRGQVLYVEKRNARHPLPMFSEAGKVGPGYCTGVGKAMLAHLPDRERCAALQLQAFHPHTAQTITSAEELEIELAKVREEGIAFDREEHEPGIVCVAAPILSPTGRVLGGLSVTTSTARRPLEDLATLAPLLRETAEMIAEDAADWQFPG